MTFSIGEVINSLTSKALSLPIVTTVFNNPIYTAILMTLCVILVIILTLSDNDVSDLIKSSFWLFIIFTGIIFLHNKILRSSKEAVSTNIDLFTVKSGGSLTDETVNILPFEYKF